MAQCVRCGRELAPPARWCPDCGTPLGKAARCRACGSEIPARGPGCHRCGARGAAAYGPAAYAPFLVAALLGLLLFSLFTFLGCRDERQMERKLQEWQQQHRPGR